jgi:hypothetical protein
MTTSSKPTERDQFWLEHNLALSSSGLTTKQYIEEHGLSRHALYQSRNRLRSLGLLPPAESPRARRRTKKKSAPAFSKVQLSASSRPGFDFRLSLPSSVVLEWSGEELPTSVVDLLERLTDRR